ncbi:MAG: hypothetical protein CFE24_05370 [Flavobacterium sp. BFFFF2]|nr:MAG: hypothetical protein CFE24_05370 [Flavobacterium sp. BFFFF2]
MVGEKSKSLKSFQNLKYQDKVSIKRKTLQVHFFGKDFILDKHPLFIELKNEMASKIKPDLWIAIYVLEQIT